MTVKIPDMTLYEVARRNMVAFAKWFINHNEMTKDRWFEIQKEVLTEFKEYLKKEQSDGGGKNG